MKALRHLLARLALERAGAAAVEFALILPVMLLLYLGTMEASALISTDRRVQIIAGSVGDLVARTDSQIGAATLRDYFKASEAIIAPYRPGALVQTVSMVQINAQGVARVVWSRRYLGGAANHQAGHATNSIYSLPSQITSIADGFIIVSEARYGYTPLMGLVFSEQYQLYRQNFYVPRFGGRIDYSG